MKASYGEAVIFRKYPESEGGEVLALFPEIPGTNDPATCTCYASMGQHSSADFYGVMNSTRPARPEEYAALAIELGRVGYYSMRILQRVPRAVHDRRAKAARA